LIELLALKRSHVHVCQLEALLRCGLACWKVRAATCRTDLISLPRERQFLFKTLLEHKQAAFVESPGSWSVFDLWQSAQGGKTDDIGGQQDVFVVYRKDQCSLDFERLQPYELQERLGSYRE
jgi:hypothetical protein